MLSVIIPVHNRVENIPLTLKALELQTLPKHLYEVIVVDDRSTDDTLQFLAKYVQTHENMKLASLYKKDAWNASRPRNYGAKLCEKDTDAYVFVDSDVVLNKYALACYWEDFEKNPNRVVIGPYSWTMPMIVTPEDIESRWEDYIGNKLPSRYQKGALGIVGDDIRKGAFEDKGKNPDDVFSTVFDGLACFGGNLLVPRKIFWQAGGYDEQTLVGIEDGDFGITLWKNEVDFSYDTRTRGYHAWHPIPPSRHPPDFRTKHLDRLNMKHFNTTDPDFSIIAHTREAFKQWGIEGWNPPPEWEVHE